MSQQLVPGQYSISMKVKLGDGPAGIALDGPISIAIWGVNEQFPITNATETFIIPEAQIGLPLTITSQFYDSDDCEWVSVSGVFPIGQTDEFNYLIFGVSSPVTGADGAFVFMDDVVLIKTDVTDIVFSLNGVCSGSEVNLMQHISPVSGTFSGSSLITSSGFLDATQQTSGVVNFEYFVHTTAGCSSEPFTLTINPLPIVSLAALPILNLPACPGSNFDLYAFGAASYEWFPTNNLLSTSASTATVNPTQGGDVEYEVQGTDLNGCQASAAITLHYSQAIELIPDVININCSTGELASINISANGVPPLTYNWSNIPGESDLPDQENLDVGLYALAITDGNGCQFSEVYYIQEPSSLLVDLIISSQSDLDTYQNAAYEFSGDIIINSGAHVAIHNSDFYFSPGKHLIINEGASLDLTNCKLTSCENTWGGVVIESRSTTTLAEGALTMTNGSISYAQTGIYTKDSDYNLLGVTNENMVAGSIVCKNVEIPRKLYHQFRSKVNH